MQGVLWVLLCVPGLVGGSWFLRYTAREKVRILFFVVKETRPVSFLSVRPEQGWSLGRLRLWVLLQSIFGSGA